MAKLEIKNLHVNVGDVEILKGVNLTIESGETIALLGPNGHGKSTLIQTIMGNPKYTITKGSILLDGRSVLEMSVDERSRAGIFLGMQYPSEIPGVNNADFLKAAMNVRQDKPLSLFQFYRLLENAYKEMDIPLDMSTRSLNEGFSGGEKKRNEILQMILLNPEIIMLDEIDSGLDVDAMKIVANAIKDEQEKGKGFLVISHYARLYDLIKTDKAAVMINGQIVLQGNKDIVSRIDKEGYEWLKSELGIEIEKDSQKQPQISLGVCAAKEIVNHGK
jgi:Fe-S cluster assembly ATP-binding protein